jgi:hypothetical protein
MWVEQKKRNWKRKVITLHEDGDHSHCQKSLCQNP